MKKYLLGIFAVILAVGLSAFTVVQKNANPDPIYWYSPDGLEPMGVGAEPDTDCPVDGPGCAKGFDIEPTNPVTEGAQHFRTFPE